VDALDEQVGAEEAAALEHGGVVPDGGQPRPQAFDEGELALLRHVLTPHDPKLRLLVALSATDRRNFG
jgi:hypothetical protein